MASKKQKSLLHRPISPTITRVVLGLLIILVIALGIYVFKEKQKQLSYRSNTSNFDKRTLVQEWTLLSTNPQNWHFTIEYPSNIHVITYTPLIAFSNKVGDQGIDDANYKDANYFSFAIDYMKRNSINIDNVITPIFTAPVGVLDTSNLVLYQGVTVTKLAKLDINGHEAVHYTQYYPGSQQQPGEYKDSYIIKEDNNSFYEVYMSGWFYTNDIAGFLAVKNNFQKNSELMSKIVNTFKIY